MEALTMPKAKFGKILNDIDILISDIEEISQDEIAHQKVSTCYHQVLQEISAIQKFAKIFL